MSKVVVMDHPLIQHKIGIIRREETGSKDFRTLVSEIAMLMCYEATRDLKLTDVEINTPICKTTVKELKGKKLAVVPILRAGLGMVDGMLNMIPAAKVGHIGLYRDPETLEPVEYYCKLPADCANREVFVVDPMLATGGSSVAAIQMLKDKGVKKYPPDVHYRSTGRCEKDAGGTSGCGYLHRRARRSSERARLHCTGTRRCGRPYFRHEIESV